ncbi:MAG: hypothetical protein R3Y59_04005 [bacterium]
MKILCPFCLQNFDNSKAQLICSNSSGKCTLSPTKEFSAYWGLSDDDITAQHPHIYKGGHSLFGGVTKMKDCPICGDDRPDYVCPHCHNSLPKDMVLYGTDIIPIIGGPAVGKTCYMVALIHQLNKYGWRLNLTSSLQSLYGGDAARIYEGMQEQLFKNKEVLDKTPVKVGINAPWFVKIEPKVKNKKATRPTYLIFYDIAGEQYQDAKIMKMQAAPIKHASGAIVLLDTFDIPKMKDIKKKLGIEDSTQHFSIEKTVAELCGLSTENRVLEDSPIAFAFSKADAIHQYSSDLGAFGQTVDLNQNSLFIAQKYKTVGSFKNNDFKKFLLDCEQVNDGFLAALEECDMQQLIHNNRWDPENICFFGVSSLGQDPDQFGIIETETITPHRVLDPLIWILNKLGKIEIPK